MNTVVLLLIFVALIAWLVAKAFRKSTPVFCADCGTEAPPKSHTRGSILIEIVLWCMLLLPGLIYSIWRLTTRRQVCSACGSERILPAESPMARKLRADLGQPPAPSREFSPPR